MTKRLLLWKWWRELWLSKWLWQWRAQSGYESDEGKEYQETRQKETLCYDDSDSDNEVVFVNSSPVFSEEHDPQSGYESGEEKETRQKEALCCDNGENCDNLRMCTNTKIEASQEDTRAHQLLSATNLVPRPSLRRATECVQKNWCLKTRLSKDRSRVIHCTGLWLIHIYLSKSA